MWLVGGAILLQQNADGASRAPTVLGLAGPGRRRRCRFWWVHGVRGSVFVREHVRVRVHGCACFFFLIDSTRRKNICNQREELKLKGPEEETNTGEETRGKMNERILLA